MAAIDSDRSIANITDNKWSFWITIHLKVLASLYDIIDDDLGLQAFMFR